MVVHKAARVRPNSTSVAARIDAVRKITVRSRPARSLAYYLYFEPPRLPPAIGSDFPCLFSPHPMLSLCPQTTPEIVWAYSFSAGNVKELALSFVHILCIFGARTAECHIAHIKPEQRKRGGGKITVKHVQYVNLRVGIESSKPWEAKPREPERHPFSSYTP